MLPSPGDLDPSGTLAALEDALRRRRQAEVDDLELVLHWCVLHSTRPYDDVPGGERLEGLGGDGTPGVQELALCELAIARGVHTLAARSVVADALDLRHRLPLTWSRVRGLQGEVWVARKVAALSRRLSYEQVAIVDRAVADAIGGQAPSRVIALCEAKVIEADEAAHAARIEQELKRRYVGLSRIDSEGLQSVIARVTAGEAADVDAFLDRVAHALSSRPEHTGLSRDELRAEAFGWLARPDDLLALLAGAPEPRRFRRRAVLYVHLHEAALDAGAGVARVEGLGPHTLAQVARLVGHRRVTVKPVIDLAHRVSVNAYEFPEWIKERIRLIHPGDAFPHASRLSRRVDIDHPWPYDVDGPPGQTNSHDGQPLSRTGHRAKTHLGYRCTRLPTGETLWRTPHGRHRIVDHLGTRVIDDLEAAAWESDDPSQRSLARSWHLLKTERSLSW
ncbi:MAG TPA: hypothetical protein VFO49_07600 [Nocardioides sp.]|nr:hypothetical protein [Nocardioides sp.]